eukprot:3186996-Amphidinium_carterae.2
MQGARKRSESRVTFEKPQGWAEAKPDSPTAQGNSSVPGLYYLSRRAERIPLSRQSLWTHNAAALWPNVGKMPEPSTDYCRAVRRILAENLQKCDEIPEWCFAQQDCYEGRESAADASAVWVGGRPATPMEVLQDFFPLADCKFPIA